MALLRLPGGPPVSPAKAGVHVPSTLRPSQWLAGGPLRLPGESRGPRPWGLGADVVSGFRRNDGWGGESRGPRPFHASAISVVGRRPYSVSPAKAGVPTSG